MKGKVLPVAEAIAGHVPANCTLAIGGMHLHNNPMALVFELVRQHRSIKRLITSPSASLNADVLVGSRLVTEVMTSYVGFEHLGLAPCFRRAAESGEVRVLDLDEGSLTHALYAGASGMPFAALPRGLQHADVWRSNSDSFRVVDDPFGSGAVLAVRAIRPDVAIVHGAEASADGTTWMAGALFTDRLMALAAKHVIVQVERVVPGAAMSRRPAGSTIPGFLVEAVVEAPGGCLPASSHTNYACDEMAVKDYLRAARTEEGFTEWVARKVPALTGATRT